MRMPYGPHSGKWISSIPYKYLKKLLLTKKLRARLLTEVYNAYHKKRKVRISDGKEI